MFRDLYLDRVQGGLQGREAQRLSLQAISQNVVQWSKEHVRSNKYFKVDVVDIAEKNRGK